MGKKEFASQQPTQNLGGRGGRGVYNTARAKGMSAADVHRSTVFALSGTLFTLRSNPNWGRGSPPSSPFFI